MRSSQYTRDAKRVKKAYKRIGTEIIAVETVKVQIPARFQQQDLAIFESESTFIGYAAWIVEDKYYAVSRVSAFMRTEPSLINNVLVDDQEMIEMTFEPGARIVANTKVRKLDSVLYSIYDEFQAKGKAPWYLSYEDYGKLFEKSLYYNGVRLGANSAIQEMIVAAECRNPENPKEYYRHFVETPEDLVVKPPVVVGLRDTATGPTNTISRLLGPYLDDNITGALFTESTRLERVDRLLRT